MSTAGPAAESGHPHEAAPRGRLRGPALVVLAALVGAGAVLRFVTRSPLWLDEALSVNLASLPLSDLPGALRHDGHPGLYYVLLGRWIDLFGDSDGAVRALSGIFSLATVPAVWGAARMRFGERVALHAAVLSAASPFLIRYGSESRMYALVGLVVAAGWLSIEKALVDPDRKALVSISLLTAIAVHTHYWTIWLVAVVFVLAVIGWRRGDPVAARASGRVAVAVAIGAATFVVWLPVFVDQVAHTGTPWADRARPAEIAVETVEAMGGGMRFEPVLLGIVLVVFAVLGTFAMGRTRDGIEVRTRPPATTSGIALVVVATLGSGGFVAIITGGGFEARYSAVVMPLLLVLAARGTSLLGHPAGLAVVILIAGLGVAVSADDARRDRSQGQDAAALIDAGASAGDLVVFCPDQLAPATLRYLDYPGPELTYPTTDDPAFVDWYDYHDRITALDPARFTAEVEAMAGDNAIWLVMMTSYRGFEDRCETITSILATNRPQTTPLVGSTAFEPMFLHRFGAPR